MPHDVRYSHSNLNFVIRLSDLFQHVFDDGWSQLILVKHKLGIGKPTTREWLKGKFWIKWNKIKQCWRYSEDQAASLVRNWFTISYWWLLVIRKMRKQACYELQESEGEVARTWEISDAVEYRRIQVSPNACNVVCRNWIQFVRYIYIYIAPIPFHNYV